MLLEGRQGEVAFVPIESFPGRTEPDATGPPAVLHDQSAALCRSRAARLARSEVWSGAGRRRRSDRQGNRRLVTRQNAALYARQGVADHQSGCRPRQGCRAGHRQSSPRWAGLPGCGSAGRAKRGRHLGRPADREQFNELAGAASRGRGIRSAGRRDHRPNPVRDRLARREDRRDQARGRQAARSGARRRSSTKIVAQKRKEALEELVDKVQDALDDGSSFSEAAAAAKLTPTETPPITADGRSRTDPNFKLAPELMPVLKSGFELAENDEPVIETLPNDAGYVMVAPARVIAAAPAPLRAFATESPQDWINDQASQRAKQLADAIGAKGAQRVARRCGEGRQRAGSSPADQRPADPARPVPGQSSRRRWPCCSAWARARSAPLQRARAGLFRRKAQQDYPGQCARRPGLVVADAGPDAGEPGSGVWPAIHERDARTGRGQAKRKGHRRNEGADRRWRQLTSCALTGCIMLPTRSPSVLQGETRCSPPSSMNCSCSSMSA